MEEPPDASSDLPSPEAIMTMNETEEGRSVADGIGMNSELYNLMQREDKWLLLPDARD